MTEETQALERFKRWIAENPKTARHIGAAAALTSLARDLETARQERDAALEMARRVGESGDHHIQMALDGRTREREAVDAAVRAARAETWEAAATGLMAGADTGGRRSVKGQVLVNAASKFLSIAAELRAAREGQ